MQNGVVLGGVFSWRHLSRPGKSGCRQVIDGGYFSNGLMLAGLNDLLNVFGGAVAAHAFYAGLIDINGFSAISPGDTLLSHPGWFENTSYLQSGRPQWSPGAAAGQTIANGALFNYTMSAPATLHGFFIASNSTKGGTSGVLFAAGVGDVDQTMQVGEILQGGYTLTAAAGVGS